MDLVITVTSQTDVNRCFKIIFKYPIAYLIFDYWHKGCDSNFEVKLSKFKSWYKWNNYLTL